eukprot:TRINITY_DN46023_c0_g1_i1.p1 TRINITY_DN46023_c0_g1~~TRINITY_DN46023_c0_g1_i1.p1  ORF type:complete len:323 (+),score=58.21 TRINITY_DN46023_c0_g1_i1:609-1577(+)
MHIQEDSEEASLAMDARGRIRRDRVPSVGLRSVLGRTPIGSQSPGRQPRPKNEDFMPPQPTNFEAFQLGGGPLGSAGPGSVKHEAAAPALEEARAVDGYTARQDIAMSPLPKLVSWSPEVASVPSDLGINDSPPTALATARARTPSGKFALVRAQAEAMSLREFSFVRAPLALFASPLPCQRTSSTGAWSPPPSALRGKAWRAPCTPAIVNALGLNGPKAAAAELNGSIRRLHSDDSGAEESAAMMAAIPDPLVEERPTVRASDLGKTPKLMDGNALEHAKSISKRAVLRTLSSRGGKQGHGGGGADDWPDPCSCLALCRGV